MEKPIDALSDIELEESLRLLEMEIRWNRNHAYALAQSRQSRLLAHVRRQEALLRKLWDEREYRILQGAYHPFT